MHPQAFYEFKMVRRVEFSDTDMAGIMHFSNFFKFMESAEHAFFRSLGFSVACPDGHKQLGLPRVHAQCHYLAPLRFEDEVEVHLLVEKKSTRSITYQFCLRRIHPESGEAARGRITVACVEHFPDGSIKAVPLPKAIFDKIEPAPAPMLAHSTVRDPATEKQPS